MHSASRRWKFGIDYVSVLRLTVNCPDSRQTTFIAVTNVSPVPCRVIFSDPSLIVHPHSLPPHDLLLPCTFTSSLPIPHPRLFLTDPLPHIHVIDAFCPPPPYRYFSLISCPLILSLRPQFARVQFPLWLISRQNENRTCHDLHTRSALSIKRTCVSAGYVLLCVRVVLLVSTRTLMRVSSARDVSNRNIAEYHLQ